MHYDVIKWKHFPRNWPFVRGIHRWIDLRLNKRLSKQSRGWWFETPSRSLWRQRRAYWNYPPVIISSLGHHIITGGHQISCGGFQSITGGNQMINGGHQLLCDELQLISPSQQLLRGGLQLITRYHQLITGGHHIITGGHQSLYGGLQLITRGHQLLCGGPQLTVDYQLLYRSLQLITRGHPLLCRGLQLITRGHQLLCGGLEITAGGYFQKTFHLCPQKATVNSSCVKWLHPSKVWNDIPIHHHYIHYKMSDKITHPFRNFNGAAVEVRDKQFHPTLYWSCD